MRVSGFFSGGSPIVKRYQVNQTVGTAGVPLVGGATTTTGIQKASTTSLANLVGLAVDTATYSTTQLGAGGGGGGSLGAPGGSGGGVPASAAAYVGVIINPDMILSSLLSQGATSGTAITARTNTSASAGGLVYTAAVGTATYVDGTVWTLVGANAGSARIVTSWVSNTSLTTVVPVDYAIAVNDTFAAVPYQPFGRAGTATTMQLTTDLTQSDMSIAVGTGFVCTVIELFLRDAANNGTTDSWVVFSPTILSQLLK